MEQNKNFDLLEYKFNKEDYLTPDQTKLLVTKLTEFATKLYKIYGNVRIMEAKNLLSFTKLRRRNLNSSMLL